MAGRATATATPGAQCCGARGSTCGGQGWGWGPGVDLRALPLVCSQGLEQVSHGLWQCWQWCGRGGVVAAPNRWSCGSGKWACRNPAARLVPCLTSPGWCGLGKQQLVHGAVKITVRVSVLFSGTHIHLVLLMQESVLLSSLTPCTSS